MQHPKVSDLRAARPPRRPGLLAPPASGPDLARAAAEARVRHAVVRSVQEFLDRAGCVELDHPADAALAATLGRVCWPGRGAVTQGLLAGADGATLLDLLERGLIAALHGALSRAYADLQTLGVDLDLLKYVRLPVQRVPRDVATARWTSDVAAWAGAQVGLAGAAGEIVAEIAEPTLVVSYSAGRCDDDPDGAAPCLREARLLLPGAGCVAAATEGGAFSFDTQALTRFVCAARIVVLARPALA
jgi:hypothetical protein